MILKKQREKVIEIARRAQNDKLILLTMGNFSCRDKDTGYICVTPSGMEYTKLQPEDIVVVDKHMKIIDGNRKPSIETPLHCAAYRKRSDIFGVAHTHSTFGTAWACCGKALPVVLAEVANQLAGEVLCAPYQRPGSSELAEIVTDFIKDRNATLMGNHGVLAVGKDLDSAYINAVIVEEGAKVGFYAKMIGDMKIIPEDECITLHDRISKIYGQE